MTAAGITAVLVWAGVVVLASLPLLALIVIVCVIVCALQRHWPRLPRWMRPGRVPSRCPDGRPLTVPEKERWAWIEDGYAKTAREPGRRR
jgi:hypothetical protein